MWPPLMDAQLLAAEAERVPHDSWDNPDWECDGWTLDTRVDLTAIVRMDEQLGVLRETIDGMETGGTEKRKRTCAASR